MEARITEALEYLHNEIPSILRSIREGDTARAEVQIALELRRTDLELDMDFVRAIREQLQADSAEAEPENATREEQTPLEPHEFPRYVVFVCTFNPDRLPQTRFAVDARAAYKLSDRVYDCMRAAKSEHELRSDEDFLVRVDVNPGLVGACAEFIRRGKHQPVPSTPQVKKLKNLNLRAHTEAWVVDFLEEFKNVPGRTNDDLFCLANTAAALGLVELATIISADLAIKMHKACEGNGTSRKKQEDAANEAVKRWGAANLLFDTRVPLRTSGPPPGFRPYEVVPPAMMPVRIYQSLRRRPEARSKFRA